VKRAATLALALLALWAAFAFRPDLRGGVDLRDFEAYYAAGATWADGDDAYSRRIWGTERAIPGVVATRDELLPFVGPPFGLPLWAGFARFTYPQAALAWRIVLGLSFATLTLGALRLASASAHARRSELALDAGAALAFGVAFTPLTSGLALGQVAAVSSAAVVAALLALRARGTLSAAGAALVAALQPNVGIVLAARLPERRAWIAFALAASVALGGSLLAADGPEGFAHYLTTLREHVRAENGSAIQTTFAGVLAGLGVSNGTASLAGWALAVAVLAILLVQFRSGRFGVLERVALTSAALPIALPFAHEHDFTPVLFPALLCARRARGWPRAFGALAATAVAIDWLGLAQRPAGCAQAACLALAAAFAFVALGTDAPQLRDLTAVLFAPLVLAAGALAKAHPLPIWPDALAVTFQAPAGLDVSAVWALEQSTAGLMRAEPLWALLRLIALAACVALWVVATRVLARDSANSSR
jgi:Glycosyltransferase family 87